MGRAPSLILESLCHVRSLVAPSPTIVTKAFHIFIKDIIGLQGAGLQLGYASSSQHNKIKAIANLASISNRHSNHGWA
jgi:hypothetical protein